MFSDSDAWVNRRKWYESENQYVRRQRSEAESRAADADERLRRSLREVTAQKEALAAQVARLSAAFDAFVELTEAREELAGFTAAAADRDRARALLASLLSPGSAAAAAVDPNTARTPGYWLPWASDGLAALLQGDRQSAATALEAASRCDAQRTALFLCLALPAVPAVSGAPSADSAAPAPWLTQALGRPPASPDDEIAAGARELWRQAARGTYGGQGRATVVEWLASAHSAETVERLRELTGSGSGSTARSSSDDSILARLARARAAAASLEALARWFEPSSSSAAPSSLAAQPAGAPPTAPLVLLEGLIAEGSPDEADLIRRVRELNREVRGYRRGASEAQEAPPLWDASAGRLLDVLKRDLAVAAYSGADAAEFGSMAREVLRPSAAELADRILGDAAAEPPEAITLRLDGQDLELVAALPLDPQLRALDEAVDRRYAPEPGHPSRRQLAESAERAAARKAKNRVDARAAVERFAAQCAEISELARATRQRYDALQALFGRPAERDSEHEA